MKILTYLFVSSGGNVRVNKTGTGIRPNELRLQVTIDVPDAVFRRPTPIVDIKVPDVSAPDMTEATIELTAESVARALQLDVHDVQDGLTEALRRHEDRRQETAK